MPGGAKFSCRRDRELLFGTFEQRFTVVRKLVTIRYIAARLLSRSLSPCDRVSTAPLPIVLVSIKDCEHVLKGRVVTRRSIGVLGVDKTREFGT